jgi:hypothetical protein
MTQALHTAGRTAQGHKDTLGRIGLVGRGVLYAVIGLLALQLAIGSPDEQASPQGAIEWIGEQPLGRFLLVALTLSLVALAVWRALDAWRGDPVEGAETSDRVRYAAQAVIYAGFAVASLSVTVATWSGSSAGASGSGSSGGAGGASGGGSQQQATAVVLDWPGGQLLVGAAGLALIGYAAWKFVKHTLHAEFMERLSGAGEAVERFGRVGYAARAVVWAVVGVLLIQAALTHDPNQAGGLSAALQELAGSGLGRLVLVAVAVGLFAFGALSVVEAKYRRAA